MFEKASDLDPTYALAYARCAWTHLTDWSMGWNRDPRSLEQAFELAQKAISLEDSLPEAHGLLGYVYLWKKQHEQALAEVEKAIALDPNNADGYAGLGEILIWVGRSEEGLELLKRGMRLNPHYPIWYLCALGQGYTWTGRYEEATEVLERAKTRTPDFLPPHVLLALIYVETGCKEKAEAEVAEIRRISPDYSLEMLRETTPIMDQAVLERVLQALRQAGLE
jgi:adenylate cyclase